MQNWKSTIADKLTMIKKQFYSHLVDVEVLYQELDSLDLSETEKEELKHHVHGSIHYTVLDVVMSEMPEEHKKSFLHHVINSDHEKVWEHLKDTTENIEEKIKRATGAIIKGFLDDIQKTRKN